MKLVNVLSLLGALAIGSTVVGCLNDSGPARKDDALLIIQAGVKDVNKTQALSKTSVIKLKKLVITLRSSDAGDAVRRDTVLADTGASFVSTATSDQVVLRNYKVTPLRSWTVIVKTLDEKDSVVHYDSTLASNLLVGETRPITVTLKSRFVMYEAKFALPDSLIFTQLDSLKQQLIVDRMMMIVDGDTVIDSTRTPRFAPGTTHSIFFDYIDVNERPDVKIEFFGRVGADTTSGKLFEYLFTDVHPDSTSPTPVTAVYTGPNAADLGAGAAVTINIGKVGTVVFQPIIDPNVTTKRSAQ